MAQENRLLDQVGYFRWIQRVANLGPEQMLFGTWGFSCRDAFSIVRRTLEIVKQNTRKPPQILCGFTNLNHAIRSIEHAKLLPGIEIRFVDSTHAKYAVASFDSARSWQGAIGSSNLTDTTQLNLSCVLAKEPARTVSLMHRGYWKKAKTAEELLKTMRNLAPLEQTVYKANDVGVEV